MWSALNSAASAAFGDRTPRAATRTTRQTTEDVDEDEDMYSGHYEPPDRPDVQRDEDESDKDEDEENEYEGEEDAEDEDEEDEGEEDEGEEDEDEDEDGDDGGADDNQEMSTDVGVLQDMVVKLRAKVTSLRQSARAKKRRCDHHRPTRRKEGEPEPTAEQLAYNALKHEQRHTKFFLKEMQLRGMSRAKLVNRLALSLTDQELDQLDELGFVQYVRFVEAKRCVAVLSKELYNAENTLEIRLRDKVTVRAMRRIRQVLSEVRSDAGRWERLVLARPPKHRGKGKGGGGEDKALRKDFLTRRKVFYNSMVYAPYVVADDKAVKQAHERHIHHRAMDVAVPSEDGLAAAAWDPLEVCKDVFTAVKDNLRPAQDGRLRRLWVGVDGLTWTARAGLVRWTARCTDTKDKHNDPKYSRDGITAAGRDKNTDCVAASKIGGEKSFRARTDDGVVVVEREPGDLPKGVVDNEYGMDQEALEAIMRYECRIELPVGPEGEEQKCLLVQGGDRAAGHALYGLDSCVAKQGVCFRCLSKRGGWTMQCDCDSAIRRTAVLQSVLNHRDPRPRMKGYKDIAPFRCPCCPGRPEITPEFEAAEKERLDAMSDSARTAALRAHAASHHGAQLLEELVFFMDPKWRGSSHLHRRTNMAQNNILATFMTVPFDRSMRLAANEACDDAGMYFRFPAKNKNQRCGRLGNGDDARILHSSPGLIFRLIEIFYRNDELLKSPEVAALLEELKAAAAAGQKLVGPLKRSRPRKRTAAVAAAKAMAESARPPPAKKKKKKSAGPQGSSGPGVQAGASVTSAPPPRALTEAQVKGMKVAELKAELAARGKSTSG